MTMEYDWATRTRLLVNTSNLSGSQHIVVVVFLKGPFLTRKLWKQGVLIQSLLWDRGCVVSILGLFFYDLYQILEGMRYCQLSQALSKHISQNKAGHISKVGLRHLSPDACDNSRPVHEITEVETLNFTREPA